MQTCTYYWIVTVYCFVGLRCEHTKRARAPLAIAWAIWTATKVFVCKRAAREHACSVRRVVCGLRLWERKTRQDRVRKRLCLRFCRCLCVVGLCAMDTRMGSRCERMDACVLCAMRYTLNENVRVCVPRTCSEQVVMTGMSTSASERPSLM